MPLKLWASSVCRSHFQLLLPLEPRLSLRPKKSFKRTYSFDSLLSTENLSKTLKRVLSCWINFAKCLFVENLKKCSDIERVFFLQKIFQRPLKMSSPVGYPLKKICLFKSLLQTNALRKTFKNLRSTFVGLQGLLPLDPSRPSIYKICSRGDLPTYKYHLQAFTKDKFKDFYLNMTPLRTSINKKIS